MLQMIDYLLRNGVKRLGGRIYCHVGFFFFTTTSVLLGNWQRDKVCTQLIAFIELRLAFCCLCKWANVAIIIWRSRVKKKKAVKDDRHPSFLPQT